MASQTTTVVAPDISCDHCKMTIEKAVGDLQGVQSVAVAVEPKQVTVNYDPDAISWEQIAATLDEEGYPVQA
jgi:copper ion binding protein